MLSHSVMSDSCDPTDYSLPGSSVHRILQARILKWVAMPSSRGPSWPRGWTHVSCIAGGFFTTESPGSPRSNRNSNLLLVGIHSVIATLEDDLMVSYRIDLLLPYNPVSRLDRYLPKRVESLCPKKKKKKKNTPKTCTQMFIAALLIMAKTWKQSRCFSVGEWINKLWYIHSAWKIGAGGYQTEKWHRGNLNAYY